MLLTSENQIRQRQLGLSLTELMIALTVIGVGVLGAAQLYFQTQSKSGLTQKAAVRQAVEGDQVLRVLVSKIRQAGSGGVPPEMMIFVKDGGSSDADELFLAVNVLDEIGDVLMLHRKHPAVGYTDIINDPPLPDNTPTVGSGFDTFFISHADLNLVDFSDRTGTDCSGSVCQPGLDNSDTCRPDNIYCGEDKAAGDDEGDFEDDSTGMNFLISDADHLENCAAYFGDCTGSYTKVAKLSEAMPHESGSPTDDAGEPVGRLKIYSNEMSDPADDWGAFGAKEVDVRDGNADQRFFATKASPAIWFTIYANDAGVLTLGYSDHDTHGRQPIARSVVDLQVAYRDEDGDWYGEMGCSGMGPDDRDAGSSTSFCQMDPFEADRIDMMHLGITLKSDDRVAESKKRPALFNRDEGSDTANYAYRTFDVRFELKNSQHAYNNADWNI